MDNLTIRTRKTLRRSTATNILGVHLNLTCLKATKIENGYLYKNNIPPYPQPEFHVSHLKHETDAAGLEGIYGDSGFRGSEDEGSENNFLVWFNLAVGPEEIRSAEKRLLKKTFPELQEVEDANDFLWKFSTSPAFSHTSPYGSFRFTFPLQEVLNAYSQQFCSGDQPVMRVYRTSVFPQEIQYIVLVHRPADNERFSDCPLLEAQPGDAVCSYRDEHFIWNSQAMSQTHSYQMVVGANQINEAPVDREQFYVWDVVSIVLHLEPGEVLKFPQEQLGEYLTYCDMFDAPFMDYRTHHFIKFDDAKHLVEGLWPSMELKKQTSLQEHFEVSVHRDEDPE